MEKDKVLEVKNLKVFFNNHGKNLKAVQDVSFDLNRGEILAIVGESGSGKSVTAQSIIGITEDFKREGRIIYKDLDLLSLSEREMGHIRGSKIGMVFQNYSSSLNPTMKIGKQIGEGLIKHQSLSKKEAIKKSIKILEKVGIKNPENWYHQYPHQLSGGMGQRVMIAIALACNPDILICDEPTTALDKNNQRQIIKLLKEIQVNLSTSIIFITHDLNLINNFAQRLLIMYGGLIVERGPADIVERYPSHPYTKGLYNSILKKGLKAKTKLYTIEGSPPDLTDLTDGCPFFHRCKHSMKICQNTMAKEFEVGTGHRVSCWLYHPLCLKNGKGEKDFG